jgi:archaeal flagellar protein FlaJ
MSSKEKIKIDGDSAPAPFVSAPLRRDKKIEDPQVLKNFFKSMAAHFPRLKKDIAVSEMQTTSMEFVRRSFFESAILTAILTVVSVYAASSARLDILELLAVLFIGVPLFFMITFNSSLYKPKILIKKRQKAIDQEIVFAGRHLLIELRSGVTLYDSMVGVSREYGEVSREFNKIVEKIALGVPANVALHDVADYSPSSYFRRIVLQIANSLSSGSDVADSLEVVLEQVAQEQVISLKAYGQKLNPIVMFFMLFGVIMPSLGVAFMIIVFSVVGAGFAKMGATLLIGALFMLAVTQYLFLSIAENSRPNFDLS